MVRKNQTIEANGLIKMILSGAIVSLTITAGCIAIFTSVISYGMIPWESMGYCAYVTLVLSSFSGAVASTGNYKEKVIYIRLAASTVYVIGLLAITALCFDGNYQGVVVTITAAFLGCILSVLFGRRGIKRKNSAQIKNRRR